MMANKARRTMAKTDDRESIFICQGKYKYKILAATLLVRSNQPKPEPHDDEWKAIVTIYRTSNDEPDKAQSFPDHPHYGATEDDARTKGHDYGRKLIQGTVEGLKEYMT
jgi:hypothetical protein